MYFNRRVLLSGISILALSSDVVIAGDCHQSIVKAASDADFLSYALLNCAKSSADATKNVLGNPILDPQTCVSNFGTSLGAGACLNDYVKLASDIGALTSPFTAVAAGDGCKYDSTNGLRMSYLCFQNLAASLIKFYNSAGYPVSVAACDPIQVRSQTLGKIFPNAIKDTLIAFAGTGTTTAADYAYNTGTKYIVASPWAKTSTGYKASVDVKEGMCLGAYQVVLDMLQGRSGIASYTTLLGNWGLKAIGTDANGPSVGWRDFSNNDLLNSLMTACRTDPTSTSCSNSPAVSGIKSLFADLSGYDIGFSGPICDADVVANNVDKSGLRPTPYQFFVMCGLMAAQNPDACSSDSVKQYIATLQEAVGSDCLGCYDEMSTAIEALVTDTATVGACNSVTNITSDACVAALAPVATAFKQCTGADLYTKLPSSLPSNNGSNTTSNSTTNGTSDSSSVESGRVLMSSGVIVIVAVLTYLM